MELTPVLREHTAEVIENFIASKAEEADAKGVVLGLSGGLDSSVVARLCAEALGAKKVLGITMPHGERQNGETKDAAAFAKKLGISHKVFPISEIMENLSGALGIGRNLNLAAGNIAARVRMTVIYYHANCSNKLVMGTGNKSELLMGYFTKFGDGGSDYQPIGDLYKTQVRELARELKIPVKILKKVPTAGLWKGQTDEGEMGIKYESLDKILYGIELGLTEEEIRERTGIPLKEIMKVHETVRKTTHKRKMPLIPKVGVRTLGADWRE